MARGEHPIHSELGRENPQRRWYFVLRHGRVGRCRALKLQSTSAGWSSLVARQAHNLKVAGSNPAPATIYYWSYIKFFLPIIVKYFEQNIGTNINYLPLSYNILQQT